MSCNWWRWLWGIIPLLVLSWVAIQAEQGRVEADLRARATLALAHGGMGWVVAEFVGRDAVLRGQAADEGEPQKAADLVRGIWGVGAVDNRVDLAPSAEKYAWSASRRGNRVRIKGHVPNRVTRRIILSVAKANFPGFELVDRMDTTRGVPSPDTWLGGVSFALKQLTSLKRGDVRLEGLGMWIAGEAEDMAAYRAIKSALANNLPKGIKLTEDRVTAPVVSPFTWSAQLTGGRLVLSGYVPSEAARAELVAAAKASVPSGSVLDKMQPGDGAPPDWSRAAVASVRELGRLVTGSAEMKDGVLTVSGLAGDGVTAEAVHAALRGAMPPTIKLTDSVKAKEPPPPPTPPMPAPEPPAPTAAPEPKDAQAPAPGRTQASAGLPAAASQPPDNKPTATPPTLPPQPAEAKPSPVPAGPAEAAVRNTGVAEAQAKAKTCEDRLQSVPIVFDVASAELDSTGTLILDKLVEAAKACPGMHIVVGGHASAEGSAAVNQELSIKRAQSVVAYLVRAGVDASRLESIGYGASRPVAPNDSSENMARNRRIEFTVRPN